MARILRRPRASEDVAGIWDHIADDDLAAADRWLDRLDRQLQLLATQPLVGRARNELAEGLRSLPMGRHVVFYVALGDGIDVVRVLHSARDIGALFGKSDQ